MRALRTSETMDDGAEGTDGAPDDASYEHAPIPAVPAIRRMVIATSSDASLSAPPAIRLPRLTLKEAQALSVISRRAVDCHIAAEHLVQGAEAVTGAAWHLTMTAGRSEPVAQACDIVVHLNWSGARMRLSLPSRAVTVWMTSRLQMDIDEGSLGSVASDGGMAREAALEAMLGEALGRLGLSGLGKPELIGIDTPRPTPSGPAEVTHPWLSHPLAHHFVVTVQAADIPREAYAETLHDMANASAVVTPEVSGEVSAELSPDTSHEASPTTGAQRRPTFMAYLETDGFGVLMIASLLQHLPEKPALRRHDALRQRLRLIVGGATSTLAALQDLHVGDIVRCDWCSLANQAPKWLAATSATGQRWRLQMDAETPGRLIFLEQSEAVNMIDNDPFSDEDPFGASTSASGLAHRSHHAHYDANDRVDAGDEAGEEISEAAGVVHRETIQDLDALPVKVSFDLGSVTVALATLRSWQPGEAIELTAPVAERQAVNIRANGMLIGQGELVDIDGHLGVIVSTLSEAADHE